MKNKHIIPCVQEVDYSSHFSQEQIALLVQKAYLDASKSESIVTYRDAYAIDLTKPIKIPSPSKVKFAGTSTLRGYGVGDTRLKVKKVVDAQEDDLSHRLVDEIDSFNNLFSEFSKLGSLKRMSFAVLRPGGWWPAHFDFGIYHAKKLNFVLTTNDGCVTCFWSSKEKILKEFKPSPNRLYLLNTALKHTAINWGNLDRVHLLLTYKELY